jgi:hypothetical protein
MSSLQVEIKASSLIREGWWRLLLFLDSSDEEILDREATLDYYQNECERIKNVSSE